METTNTKDNSVRAVETLRAFLERMKLEPHEEETSEGVAFRVALEGPTPEALAHVLTEKERFVVHFYFEGNVPSSKLPTMSEFLMRANCGLITGSFELNWTTGALRYKVGIDFSATELAEPLIRNAMLSAMDTLDVFAEVIPAVLDGSLTPEQANRVARERAASEEQ